MAHAYRLAAWAALFPLLTLSTVARADASPPDSHGLLAPPLVASGSSAPPAATSTPDPAPGPDCDEAVVAWTRRATQRTGLTITPRACPSGLVRLAIAGAGCDFEVRREGGFQRTPDGSFGVSPIVNLDWDLAPEPMKKALAGLLSALSEDRSLPLLTGRVQNHPEGQRDSETRFGSRRAQIALGAGAIALLGAVAFGLRRRRRAPRAR